MFLFIKLIVYILLLHLEKGGDLNLLDLKEVSAKYHSEMTSYSVPFVGFSSLIVVMLFTMTIAI